jgi:hypothetical protein
MIYSPLTQFHASNEFPLATGAVVTEAGQAYVASVANGKGVVAISTGAAGEVFAGFSSLQTSMASYLPTTNVLVEKLSVLTNGNVTLMQPPINGTILVTDVTGASVVFGSVSGNTLVAGTVTAGVSDHAGQVVYVAYTFTLSAQQARAIVGDVQPGGFIGNYIGQVGLGQEGIIYTNQFDTSVNWSTVTAIKLGAGGKLVASGTGTTIKAVVAAVPTVSYPYLGIRFRADF